MHDFLAQIEDGLKAAFETSTLLGQTGAHLCLASDAKRVRPLLTSYFAECLRLPIDEIIPLALASELIHSASLLHDDVIDAGDTRRGRPTVNAQWSNSIAVLSGNHLLAMAFKSLRGFSPEITQEAISVVSEMTDAAILELQMRGSQTHTTSDWRRMALGKTGSLFAFCGTSVALHANNPAAKEAFKASGHHIGQVFQLVDDLHDLKEDANNAEGSYPRLLALAGDSDPISSTKKELERQAKLGCQTLGPWLQTSGGSKIQIWLEQLTCLGCSF